MRSNIFVIFDSGNFEHYGLLLIKTKNLSRKIILHNTSSKIISISICIMTYIVIKNTAELAALQHAVTDLLCKEVIAKEAGFSQNNLIGR